MDRYARESGGRLVVTEDEFIQPPANRVPREAKLVNVVATLPGAQAESKDRIYVVSGHYDSICSPGSDAACDAPGASDDASGTAVVMEMARVMSKYQFDSTIVFMAVPGEEQGLLGSTHWTEEAKKNGLKVAAMFTNDILGNTLGGNVTEFVMKGLSNDDYFFAVQAIDKDGNASVPSFPKMQRR